MPASSEKTDIVLGFVPPEARHFMVLQVLEKL